MHPLCGALSVPLGLMSVTRGVLVVHRYSYARATLENQPCVITFTLFKMNSTCMLLCDLNLRCLSTFITSPRVFSCQNKQHIQIQYGGPCLHFMSSNFNFVNL